MRAYLLGLLAMIKCSICSCQCDNWYPSNLKTTCHIIFRRVTRATVLIRCVALASPSSHKDGLGNPDRVTLLIARYGNTNVRDQCWQTIVGHRSNLRGVSAITNQPFAIYAPLIRRGALYSCGLLRIKRPTKGGLRDPKKNLAPSKKRPFCKVGFQCGG